MDDESGVSDERIGQLLLNAELATSEQLNEALKLQKKSGERIVNILMAIGAFEARQFLDFLANAGAFPSIELEHFDIEPEVIALVPRAFALKYECVPIERSDNELTLAMVCPLDIDTIDSLEIETGLIVRPFICCSDDLLPCLHRHYETSGSAPTTEQLERSLKLSTAATMLRHLDALPALPGTIQKVREMLIEDSGTAAELGAVIERDPAITAKMLKVANSPAYGFTQSIDSVQRAVSLLGLLDTYSIIVTSAVVDILKNSRKFDYVSFWMQSTVCANVARQLGKISGKGSAGIASAALLRDLGRIALAHIVPDHYALVDQGLTGKALVAAEEAKLGLSHTEVGYQLALHWDFPDALAEVIRYHHMPQYASEAMSNSVHLVSIADAVASAFDPKSEDRDVDLSECAASMEALGLTADQVMGVLGELPEEDDSFL
jgi:HD-like signal output (HDOD) protein